MKQSTNKVRAFSCITYLTEKQINEVIGLHNRSIRSWAYILHDKDKTVTHYHLVFRTFDAWTCAQVEKWFKGFTDEHGEAVNTLVERAKDLHALGDYLTHSDPDSIEAGKYRYNKTDIKSNGLFDLVPTKDAVDDTFEMLEHMVNGASTRWMVRRYGKAYVYHYSQFQAVADAIRLEDSIAQNELNRSKYNTSNLKSLPLDQESIDI